MDKSVKYQTIPLDDEVAPQANFERSFDTAIPPQGIPPPAYEANESAACANLEEASASGLQYSRPPSPPPPLTPTHDQDEDFYKCGGSFPSPPPYSVASAELPTYEEAQRTKVIEDEEDRQRQDGTNLFSRDNDILGTDFMFFIAFFVAFLFNWVGFLLLLCFCHTLSARYGALAGFGLSLAKWTLLVKHSTDLVSSENEWLWWIIMAFGVLICARATLQYIHAKREWRLLHPLTQDRLVFLY